MTDYEAGTKYCRTCKQTKPLSEFGKCTRAPDGKHWKCLPCNRAQAKKYTSSEKGRATRAKWNRDHKEEMRAMLRTYPSYNDLKARGYQRNWHLKARYGITGHEYEAMLVAQSGLCAICKNPPKPSRKLNVDHDHSNGDVRGLLCDKCNIGLAQFQDSILLLINAVAYLEKSRNERANDSCGIVESKRSA